MKKSRERNCLRMSPREDMAEEDIEENHTVVQMTKRFNKIRTVRTRT